MDVIVSYDNRNTDVTGKCFPGVEVSEEFPFLLFPRLTVYDPANAN